MDITTDSDWATNFYNISLIFQDIFSLLAKFLYFHFWDSFSSFELLDQIIKIFSWTHLNNI